MTIITSKQASKSGPSLDHRIADAFKNELPSSTIAALLNEATDAAAAALVTNDKASAIALDPATQPEDVAKARKEMEDCQFISNRLTIASEKLQTLLAQARNREASEAAQAEYQLAVAERDKLAEELRSTYPQIERVLADLVDRIAKSDNRCRNLNMASVGPWIYPAEYMARPVPANWLTHPNGLFPSIVQGLKLPSFNGDSGGYSWPKTSGY